MLAKLTATQAATLIAARSASTYDRRQTKRRVFAEAKAAFGIPSSTKLRVELDDTTNPNYLVLRDKRTGVAIEVPDRATSTATPVATPAAVNQAVDTGTIASGVSASVGGTSTDAPTAPATRLVVVKSSDIFVNPETDEVVVRIPA